VIYNCKILIIINTTYHTIESVVMLCTELPPSPLLDNIRVMVIVWGLRGKISRTALCWIVWHNTCIHSLQHTYVSSSYRSNS